MRFIRKILYGIDTINVWFGKLSSILILLIVFIVVMDIVLRIFKSATVIGMDITCMFMAALSMLGAGYCHLADGHVKVDIVYQRWSAGSRALIDIFTAVTILTLCYVLFYYGGKVAVESFISGETASGNWAYLLWPSQALVPLGALLLGLQALAKAARNISTIIQGENRLPSQVDIGIKPRGHN